MRGVRPYRDRSDAELLQFLEDCARQTWSLEERRIFEQLIRRLRLVMERVPEGAAAVPEDPESEEEADVLTPKQYAAECREMCNRPAQGHGGNVQCGGEFQTDQGEQAFAFCGYHWGPLLGVD